MRWLALALVAGVLPFSAFLACSSDDSSTTLGTISPSEAGATKFEAGANCASSEDCETGLACLYPVGAGFTCSSFQVCVVPPPSPCDHPTVACSCLAEPIQVCDGYATDPVDPSGTCDAGSIVLPEAGAEGGAPTIEAGPDATAGTDAGADASDGASE